MTNILNKIIKIVVNVLVVILTVAIFFSIYNLISLKVLHKDYTNIIGYSIFEVVTGSMEPTISVGDLVIVKRESNYKVNDIITYRIDDDFITHRIVRVDNKYFYTRGDANNSDDNKIVDSQIIGKSILIIKNGGIWRNVILTPKVFITIIIMMILLSLCFSYIPKNKRSKTKGLDNNFDDLDCCPLKKEVNKSNDR